MAGIPGAEAGRGGSSAAGTHQCADLGLLARAVDSLGGYAVGPSPLLSAILFLAVIIPVGLLLFRWRMTSGSVWPAVIAHASWNVLIQGVFDPFTTGTRALLWTGESGLLTVTTLWLVYLVARNAVWSGTKSA